MTTVWGLHTPWMVGLVLLLVPVAVGYLFGRRRGRVLEHGEWNRWMQSRVRPKCRRPTTAYAEAYEQDLRASGASLRELVDEVERATKEKRA